MGRTTSLAAWAAVWGAAAVVGQTEEQQIEAQGFRNIVRPMHFSPHRAGIIAKTSWTNL